MMQQVFGKRSGESMGRSVSESRETKAEGDGWERKGVQEASMELLEAIRGDARHPRWAEFVARYRPMMEAYLRSKGVAESEREDVVQETFAAVAKRLPRYGHGPGEKGEFRQYLTGILRNKMVDAGRAARRRERAVQEFGEREAAAGRMRTALDYDSCDGEDGRAVRVLATGGREPGESREAWKRALGRRALRKFFADEGVPGRSREICRRLWLGEESGEEVAESMAMSRDAVYKVGSRMMGRLRESVARMMALDEGA